MLVAIGVNQDGLREVPGVAEGSKLKEVARMLKAIHAQEGRPSTLAKS